MACHYFKESYLGFCSASEILHVPGISEMEKLCFKDFLNCPIYNNPKEVHAPGIENKSAPGWTKPITA